MADRSLQIRPITGALGAEIAEIDLSADLDDGTVAATRRAWLDHLAIFFRGQNLPPERLLAFAQHFGGVVEYPFINGIEGFPLNGRPRYRTERPRYERARSKLCVVGPTVEARVRSLIPAVA
jgi:alpha-ketoglutarate-dependent taurine dioxygenase